MLETKLRLPETRIYKSRQSMGEAAAHRLAIEISRILTTKKYINIIFAAAPSQNEFLAALANEDISWGQVNAFHMDEYIGLAKDAPQGFGNFLKERVFDKFSFNAVHYLDGNATDIQSECARYSNLLEEFQVDIVCMGIGENGHLAFNDPPVADFLDPKLVKVVELDMKCRQQQVNDGCFSNIEHVPLNALTLTIPALMSASVINCVVPGERKAEAVLNTMMKPIFTDFPSTILRQHQGTVIFLDFESAKYIL